MVDFPQDWSELVGEEFEKPYFQSLVTELKQRKQRWETIYPAGTDIFRAFWLTPLDSLQVVLLGQDPYHGPWQAHGLSFSVPDTVRCPPSLQNIFKELSAEFGSSIPESGNLSEWAREWVLLLNAILTVTAHQPASHHGLWREQFTDAVITRVSEHKTAVVFLLWGAYARSKKHLIDSSKHLILEAPHPSPFSAHSGFFGCDHFRQTNEWLITHGGKPIQWVIET